MAAGPAGLLRPGTRIVRAVQGLMGTNLALPPDADARLAGLCRDRTSV